MTRVWERIHQNSEMDRNQGAGKTLPIRRTAVWNKYLQKKFLELKHVQSKIDPSQKHRKDTISAVYGPIPRLRKRHNVGSPNYRTD